MAQPSAERWGDDVNLQTERAFHPEHTETGRSAWAAWVVFGGVLMILVGAFNIIDGLVALFNDDYYLVGPRGLVVDVDFTAWGWTMLILGTVAILAGFGVMAGRMWARVVGVVMAGVNAILQLAFMAAFPLWSIVILTVDILVIWALTAHGKEAAA